jgi:nitroalkane oxidase
LAYPLFDGGNIGVRRRQLHALLSDPAYDPMAVAGGHPAG